MALKTTEFNNPNMEIAPKATRDQFGETLKFLGSNIKELVVLDADLSSSDRTGIFAEAYPDRFFNVGIAEQNMMGIAIGFAHSNKIPVVSGFTCFTVGRAWEFIRAAAYDNLSLKICTSHSGLSSDRDGGSHQSLEDIALMSTIPNMTIFCPADPRETDLMLRYMIEHPGIMYLRLMRSPLPWLWNDSYKFQFGKANMIYDNSNFDLKKESQTAEKVDITIFSTGSMTCFTPKIVQLVNTKGNLKIRVVHFGTIKPLDNSAAVKYGSATKLLVTIEEHNRISGFGNQISRVVMESSAFLPKLLCIGVDDQFGQSGSLNELYDFYGLTPEKISASIGKALKQLKV
jgi:transketolase